jgi:hypothetical protein
MLTVEKQWINVNIFDHGGDIQGRLAMSGDDSEQGIGFEKEKD